MINGMMNKHTVWQVSAGPSNRSYIDQFLKYGIALIGPGDAGPWHAERCDEEFEGGFVRRFASELQQGDVLLLRTGQSMIEAVGLVVSEYQYFPQFDDVNGWDLQHGRRVRWCRLPEPYNFGKWVFGANPSRFSRIQIQEVASYANRFIQSPPMDWQARTLPSLPHEEITLKEPPLELRELVAHANDLAGLYGDPDVFGERPKEDELVAHYVIPFLRALDWPVEKIAVKWHQVDVSLFSNLPRIPEHCHYLIEAKRLGAGFGDALTQAIGYATALGIDCDVVVTDGIRYRMYEARKDYVPVAYANLTKLKESSLELFKRMKKP